MRLDWAISAGVHLTVLIVGSMTFAPSRPAPTPVQSIPVNIVSTSEKSEVTQGLPTAAQKEKSRPFVEKVGERKSVEDPNAQIAKKEVTASTDAPPPPPPEIKQQPKKKAEPRRDRIAEAIKKDEGNKAQQKKVEAKVPTPPKRPPQEQTKFDPRKVEALLDKRKPQRVEASGDEVNGTAALGAKGNAAQLSQNELDALRARLAQLWNPPAGAQNPQELVVQVRMRLRPDGTLAAPPMVMTSGTSPLFMASRDSAMRAVFRGQPFDMLRPENYELWKDIEITFDPRDMIRG